MIGAFFIYEKRAKMALSDELNNDLKSAMKNHDKTRLTIVRILKSNLMNEKIKLGHDLSDAEAAAVVNREVKQHKDSIAEFKSGGRDDLVKGQEEELKILEDYAPKQMSEADVEKIVNDTIKQLGVSGKGDFGKVMGAVMGKVKGQADGSTVNKLVNKALS